MVLTQKHILDRIKKGEIQFTPGLDKFQLQPHSIDLRLGSSFHLPRSWEMTKMGRVALHIDPLARNVDNFEQIILKDGQYFELLPNEYVVASTMEKIELSADDLMAVLFPRSSVTRRGLAINLTGLIDVGYKGFLMIPIINNTHNQVIRVYPGERICSVLFEELSSPISKERALMHGITKAKYQDNEVGFIGSKTDKQDEIDMIREGKIKQLKKQYSI
jgi:deoxycytidine triphosphate deaminase